METFIKLQLIGIVFSFLVSCDSAERNIFSEDMVSIKHALIIYAKVNGRPARSESEIENALKILGRNEDAWGNRYIVSYSPDFYIITSRGPDAIINSSDDMQQRIKINYTSN